MWDYDFSSLLGFDDIHSSYTQQHVLGIVYTQTKSLIPKKLINEKHTKYIQYNS